MTPWRCAVCAWWNLGTGCTGCQVLRDMDEQVIRQEAMRQLQGGNGYAADASGY